MLTKKLTLRWSFWGKHPILIEMLNLSIKSFHRFLGEEARYIVCCDDIDFVKSKTTDVDQYIPSASGLFSVSLSNFRKMAPQLKITDGHELMVDADVFCLKDPQSIREWIQDSSVACIQCRTNGDKTTCGYGEWLCQIDKSIPFCCNGFFGMKQGFDFTEQLLDNMYKSANMKDSYWHEQASTVKCLEPYILAGKVKMLDQSIIRYYTPNTYWFDIETEDCEMVHCIDSKGSDFFCFNQLKKLNKI